MIKGKEENSFSDGGCGVIIGDDIIYVPSRTKRLYTFTKLKKIKSSRDFMIMIFGYWVGFFVGVAFGIFISYVMELG